MVRKSETGGAAGSEGELRGKNLELTLEKLLPTNHP